MELVLEVVALVGIPLGFCCLLLAALIHLADGRWAETTGVIVAESDGPTLRWMTEEGSLHARRLHPHEVQEIADRGDTEGTTVWYREREPDYLRFHRRNEAERMLRVLGFVLGGVGVLSFVASTILTILA